MSDLMRRLMYDAMRRQLIVGNRSATRMVILSVPSDVRTAIKHGFVKPTMVKETPRVLNWYDLTPSGLGVTAQLYNELGDKATVDNLWRLS